MGVGISHFCIEEKTRLHYRVNRARHLTATKPFCLPKEESSINSLCNIFPSPSDPELQLNLSFEA